MIRSTPTRDVASRPRHPQVLAELFPGLLNELVAGEAPVLDGTDQSEAYLCFLGPLAPREGRPNDPTPLFLPSGPLAECLVRQRVRNIPTITMRQTHDVGDLTCSGQRNRVTGARVRARDHGAEHVLTAAAMCLRWGGWRTRGTS